MSGIENDVLVAKNLNFDFTAVPPHNGIITLDGLLPIGSATTTPNVAMTAGVMNSPDGSITFGYVYPNITAVVAGGTTTGKTITGNTGGARPPTGGNWNIVTANSTIVFAGAGSTLTQNFTGANFALGATMPSVTSGTNNLGVGPSVLNGITTGIQNVGVGQGVLPVLSSGTDNTAMGYTAGNAQTIGSLNTLIGSLAGRFLTSSVSNTVVGGTSLAAFTTGAANSGANTAIGSFVLSNLLTGINNTCLGTSAGNAYTGAESSNLLLNSVGILGESNTTRIGTQGTAAGQQNRCFIAGINGVTSSNPQVVTNNSSTGQMGVDIVNFAILSTGLQLKGNNTNTNPPVGFIGERLTNATSSVSVANATPTNATSVLLTPGIWDIDAYAYVVNTGTGTAMVGQISTISATFTGVAGINWDAITLTAAAMAFTLKPPRVRAVINANTTYYLVVQSNFTTGACGTNGFITATRVG